MPKKIITLQDWIDSTVELQDIHDEDLDEFILEHKQLENNIDTTNPWPWPTTP